MVGKSASTARTVAVVKKEELLVNVEVNGDDEIALVPVDNAGRYDGASGADSEEDGELSDNPDSDPELLQTADGRLILDIKRNKSCGKCKKLFKTSAEMKAHKPKCPGRVDEIQDIILKERKAAKFANPGEEFHKYCNPNPENPCYCCGEDTNTAHVGHIRCKFCPKSFKAYEYMDRHISAIHSDTDAFPCSFCNAKCSSQEVLDEHLKTHDEGKPFSCMACGKDFTRRYHLDRHEKHTNCGNLKKEVDIMPCEVCGKQFTRVDNLREHLRSHMGQGVRKRDYQCPFCPKSFYGSSLLNIHIRTHTGEKPFPCDLCPMSFPSTGALRKHRRKHTGERPYRCDECSATFAARETLNRHRKTHTGEKPHECQECGKRFIQATQLRAHMFNHTSKEAYSCSECSAVFKRKNRLTEHIKFAHQGHQPFSCDKCSKTFLRKDDLTRHEQTHTGKKPYECLTCRKFFATKNAITLHQKTHSDEGPVACHVCGGHFKRSDLLLRHMRSKHREYLDKIIDDTEKEKMEKVFAKRVAEKEATVEIDGAVYQITTVDETPIKELESEANETVEVLDVMELPSNPDITPHSVIASVPFDQDSHADMEVVISEDEKCPMPIPEQLAARIMKPTSAEVTLPKRNDAVLKVSPAKESKAGILKNDVSSSTEPKSSPANVVKSMPTKVAKQPKTLPKVASTTPTKPAVVPSKTKDTKPKPLKETTTGDTKQKRKREPKSATVGAKVMRTDDDSIPIFLSDDMLEQKIIELLEMLVGEEMLSGFGWPQAPVEEVLSRVIVDCGHQPAKGEDAGDHTTRMRENTKILFSVTMDDDDIKALLNNHTVDEVIMRVLKNK